MTIEILIINVRGFLKQIKYGFFRVEDIDRALIFSELSERDFKNAGRELFLNANVYVCDQQDREATLANFLKALERAKADQRTSYCVIGRPGRSMAEFMDFLTQHRLPTAPFAELAAQPPRASGLNTHAIVTAARSMYFPVEVVG